MKTTSIVLAAFFMLAGAVYDSETATITFGIYYTFSPTHKVIENGVEKFFPTEPEEFKKEIYAIFQKAETRINKEIFGGKKAVRLEPLWIEHLYIKDPPIFAINETQIFVKKKEMFARLRSMNLSPSKKADIYVFYLTLPLIKEEKINQQSAITRKDLSGGAIGENYMISAEYSPGSADYYAVTILLHELGHWFDLKHYPKDKYVEDECAKKIMCGVKLNTDAAFDEEYKNAWRKFYEAKTGQKPPAN